MSEILAGVKRYSFTKKAGNYIKTEKHGAGKGDDKGRIAVFCSF